jgi:hypothetical protein
MGCGCGGAGARASASPGSPSWAADFAERAAGEALERERRFNRAMESCNRSLRPTEAYLQGPPPSSSVRFSTCEDYLRYLTVRERGKYNPTVRYPTARGER